MAIPPWLGARPREMALCASWPTEKKRERKKKATRIHHLIPKLYFSTAYCHSRFSAEPAKTKLNAKCKLKCLHAADKLSHKLSSQTFKI